MNGDYPRPAPPDSPAQPGSFNRPPRQLLPALPPDEIDIPLPPPKLSPPAQNWLIAVIPSLGMGVLALFYVWRSLTVPDSGGVFVLPLLALAVFTIGGTLLAQRWRSRDYEKRAAADQLDYARLLEKKRARLKAAHNAQIALLEAAFPPADEVLPLALLRDARLWERRPDDPDFTAFRLGVGAVPSAIRIKAPDPDASGSPELERALRIVSDFRLLRSAPVIVSLLRDCSLSFCGQREAVLKLARAAVCQLALTHAPGDLRLYLAAPAADERDWRWLDWLPHVRHDSGSDLALEAGAIRRLLGSLSLKIDARLKDPDLSRQPHLLLIVDGAFFAEGETVITTILREGGRVGASVLYLVNTYDQIPSDCAAVVQIQPDDTFTFARRGETDEIDGARIEQLSLIDAEHSARALASVMLRDTGGGEKILRRVELLDLYNVRSVEDLAPQLRARWGQDIPDGVLPFPVSIGRESLGVETTLLLDEDHHGPHGVLAGTTGSGKSELLQTLVCALAIEHDPRLVNFLLIDFKGGSAFNVFASLPHTVGMVTNLDGLLVERALEALKAETRFRQQFFKQMNVRDITQYYRYYARNLAHLRDPHFHPLPHLFVIVDEFAQLAREMPEFLHELVRTAQVGRSLGLHLILGTQSPMDVITDEMNANLQFRICLRVQNVESSRAMLRRPDAAYLPAGLAGRGFLQVGERGVYKQFQTAYAGGDYRQTFDARQAVLELVTYTGETIDLLPPGQRRRSSSGQANEEPCTTAAALVAAIADYAHKKGIPPPPPLLLPPLPQQMALNAVFAHFRAGGWHGSGWLPPGLDENNQPIMPGSLPVGMVDDVTNRRQYPLWLHLNTLSGHALVIGAPGSGKTTFMQTVTFSAAWLHSPDLLHLYCLSFKGSDLNSIGEFPHAEQVILGVESERVRRLFSRLIHTLEDRQLHGGAPPLIVLLIDQYEQFRDLYFQEHHSDFERLLSEGAAVGIYLVVSASSPAALSERLRAFMPQRLVLQPGNTSDHLLLGDLPKTPASPLPRGRGFTNGHPPLMCQISLPMFDPANGSEDPIQRCAAAMRAAYGRQQGPAPLRELPDQIPLDALPLPDDRSHLVTTLGQRDDDALTPFMLNWDTAGPHFVVTGTAGAGKTNLLLAAALAAAQQRPPEKLRFLLIDFSGRSLGALDSLKHVLERVTNTLELNGQLRHLQREMEMFYARWQRGERALPRTVIMIDDYEIAADVLSINLDFLRQLRDHVHLHGDLGLHFWIAGYLDRIGDPLIKQLLRRRVGFALGGKETLRDLNIRAAHLPNVAMPRGRAYFVRQHNLEVIQTALVDNPPLYVRRINEQVWAASKAAAWQWAQDGNGASDRPVVNSRAALDIDTAGLIQDLLGDASNTD